MSITVRDITKKKPYTGITPDFIYNRYDLFLEEGQYRVVRIASKERSYEIEYAVINDWCELGIWKTPMTKEELRALLFHIRKEHPQIRRVTYRYGTVPYGSYKAVNHFTISFPKTVEELEGRMTHKSLVNLRKRKEKAERELGKMDFLEYEGKDIPEEIVTTFFQWKKEIYGRNYDMTPDYYIQHYHISHAYVMMCGDRVSAIRFACEQCPVVNGENFSYDPELRSYSLGRIIYHYHLRRMVEKGHPAMYLSGGDWEYKSHYGSVEETVYHCEIALQEEDFQDFKKKETLFEKIRDMLQKQS